MILQATMQAFPKRGDLPLVLFSPKLMACLMNQAAKEDRYLHRAAVKMLRALEGLVAANPDLVAPALKGLLGSNGDFAFDQRTRSKTADKISSHAQLANEKAIVEMLRKQLVTSIKWVRSCASLYRWM